MIVASPCLCTNNNNKAVDGTPITTANSEQGCITFLLDFCGADDSGGGYFAAEFQGWNPVPMCDYGGVWEISFCGLAAGTYEYKFLNGPDGWEFEGFGDVCTNPADNENRFVDVSGDCDIEGPWCYSQCVAGSGSPSDTEPPTLVGDLPEDITISCAEDLPDMEVLEAEDECSYGCTSEFPVDDDSGLNQCGLGEIIRTWRVFDCAGNEGAPHVQIIFIQDFESPQFINPPPDITIDCGDPLPPAVALDVEDECDFNLSESDLPVDDTRDLNPDGTGELYRIWYTEDCRGNFEEYTQTITLLPLVSEITVGEVCSDSVLLFTSEFDTYTWEFIDSMGVATNLNTNNDSIIVADAGIYRLTVEKGFCSASAQDTIVIGEPIDYLLSEGVVCSESLTGNTILDLLTLIEYNDVQDSISISNINGTEISNLTIDFDGQMIGPVAFLIEIFGDRNCPPVTDTLIVNIVDCSCPSVMDIGSVCLSDNPDTIQLTDLEPGGLTGEWNLNPPDPGIVINNGLLEINPEASPGDYELTFVFDDPDINANCLNQMPAPNISLFTIVEQIQVELAEDFGVCNQLGTGTLPSLVDLDSLVISPSNGMWFSNDPLIVVGPDNVVDFNNIPPDFYTLIYQDSDQPANCPPSLDSLIVEVVDCACPAIVIITDSLSCNNAIIDLNDFEIAGTGTWQYLNDGPDNGAVLGVDATFNTTDLQPGDYSFEFTLDNIPMNPACAASLTTIISVASTPEADVMVLDTIVCNATNNEGISTVLNLNNILVPFSDPGNWSSNSFSGDLSNPESVSFEGVESGSYLFTYQTVIAQNLNLPCEDAEASFTVTVEECQCPALPEISFPDTICTENGPISLVPDNIGVGPGTWTWNPVGGSNNPTPIFNTSFDPINLPEGNYVFEYTFESGNVPFVCEDESISYVIYFVAAPEINLPSDLTVCDRSNSSQGPSFVDFTLIDAGVPGNWTAPNNYTGDFSDLSNVNFEGLTGMNFQFGFTSQVLDNPCSDEVATLTIRVLDCSCPGLIINSIPDLCSIDASVNLDDFVDDNSVAGTWTLINDSGQEISLMNNEIDPLQVNPGVYSVVYTADQIVPSGCDQQVSLEFEIFQAANAGVDNEDAYCFGDMAIINLSDYLIDADVNGLWDQATGLTVPLNPSNAEIDISLLETGIYSFNYTVEGLGPCMDDIASVDIEISELPQIDAGEDLIIGCNTDEVILGEGISIQSNLEYTWLGPNNDPLPGSGVVQSVSASGTYTLEVMDILSGCINSDQIEVIADQSLPEFLVSPLDPQCTDLQSGQIAVSQFSGGNGMYEVALMNALSSQSVTTSGEAVFFNDLTAGTYTIIVMSDGCPGAEVVVELQSPVSFTIDAGPELQNYEDGETLNLNLALQGVSIDDLATITWTTQSGFEICGSNPDDCQSIVYTPTNEESLLVVAVDNQGCVAMDSIDFRLIRNLNIYIPNILNPRAQNENAELRVYSNNTITSLTEYIVFDRWGNIVYQDLDGKSLNDPNEDWWNGTTNGFEVSQGVYILQISYFNPDNPDQLITTARSVTVFN